MEYTRKRFTIKDLENISGIKSHTIRIWEKRYNLLTPERTSTNIRYYSESNLRQLLNIVLLYKNGYKISKIGQLSREEILEHSKNCVSEKARKNEFINEMKIAMFSFDQQLFEKNYQKQKQCLDFSSIFQECFIPFLKELGLLWQTNTINPAHEHFISSLIKQKILVHTENVMLQKTKHKSIKFVLFLPDNEIHDLGITYLNYELLNHGFQTIFLGPSIPISCLKSFNSIKETVIFISYFTVKPEPNKIIDYLTTINSTILAPNNSTLWILGHQTQQIPKDKININIKIFASIPDLLKEADGLKID